MTDQIENARRLLHEWADELIEAASCGEDTPIARALDKSAELRTVAEALPKPPEQYEQWPPGSFTYRRKVPPP